MEEYKGIFYNDNTEKKYYEGGAHFRYSDLVRILSVLAKKYQHLEEKQKRPSESLSNEENTLIKNKLNYNLNDKDISKKYKKSVETIININSNLNNNEKQIEPYNNINQNNINNINGINKINSIATIKDKLNSNNLVHTNSNKKFRLYSIESNNNNSNMKEITSSDRDLSYNNFSNIGVLGSQNNHLVSLSKLGINRKLQFNINNINNINNILHKKELSNGGNFYSRNLPQKMISFKSMNILNNYQRDKSNIRNNSKDNNFYFSTNRHLNVHSKIMLNSGSLPKNYGEEKLKNSRNIIPPLKINRNSNSNSLGKNEKLYINSNVINFKKGLSNNVSCNYLPLKIKK